MSDFKTFQFFLKKSFAKIKTEFKVKILNLIKQWQQLESNPSILHPMSIITATPYSKGECGEGGCSGGGCTGVTTNSTANQRQWPCM